MLLCFAPRATTNNLVIDHDTIIWDGTTTGATIPVVACIETATSGGGGEVTCETGGTVPAGATCELTSNIIVSDSGNSSIFNAQTLGDSTGCTDGAGHTTGCTYSSGKCTDGGNNRWYQTRLIAAQNEGWLNTTDQFGNTCTTANSCAFPYLPAHL